MSKFLNQTFTTQQSYVNLSQVGPKIIKQLLIPLGTVLSKDKNYDGDTRIQYYIKFSNQLTLKVFLNYLCGKAFPFSRDVDSEEDSIEIIIQKLNHLKDYYKTNKKNLYDIPQAELNSGIAKIDKKYLYLGNVNNQNYTHLDIDQGNQGTIALVILRYNKNIILAALKRTPVKGQSNSKKQPEKGNNEEEVPSKDIKSSINYKNYVNFAVVIVFLAVCCFWIYQITNKQKIFGLLHIIDQLE